MVAGAKPIPKPKKGCSSTRFHNRSPFRGHFCATSLGGGAVGVSAWTTRLQMAVSGYSSTPKQCPGGDPPRAVAGPPLVAFLLAAGASVLLLGCATAGHADRASSSLVAGVRAAPVSRA